ncbi:MAG TPA: hypothetical protein VMZ29_06215 [Candidatus Bathyarchaeia archaeon]|nr:hypothetical protein [Candidatus Bathyarchaeia archaeon]
MNALKKKQKIILGIAIPVIALAAFSGIYFGIVPNLTTRILVATGFGKTVENEVDVFFIGLKNEAKTEAQIANITCFSFVNTTHTINPIEVYDNDSVAILFPLEIESNQVLQLNLKISSSFTIGCVYTLTIYYNIEKTLQVSFTF